MMISNFLWVALGGALGSMLRYGFSLWIPFFPWATMAVNFVGSLLIGLLVGKLEQGSWPFYLGIIGFCGGFTTFSTFSLDILKMLRGGDTMTALFYMAVSVAICLVAVAIGVKITTN